MTILVAEDDKTNFMLIELIFQREYKPNILHAFNGNEVIQLYKDNIASGIDVIIMDLKMPVLDGYQATRAIREMNPDIPIIAVTAYAMQGDAEKALLAGCDDYVAKPIDKSILINKINTLIENRKK